MTPELQAAVEKMARAIWKTREEMFPGYTRLSWEETTEIARKAATADALAAIRAVAEATKEPTDDMENAGEKRDYRYGNADCLTHWRAMQAASILGEALRDE